MPSATLGRVTSRALRQAQLNRCLPADACPRFDRAPNSQGERPTGLLRAGSAVGIGIAAGSRAVSASLTARGGSLVQAGEVRVAARKEVSALLGDSDRREAVATSVDCDRGAPVRKAAFAQSRGFRISGLFFNENMSVSSRVTVRPLSGLWLDGHHSPTNSRSLFTHRTSAILDQLRGRG